MESEVPEMALSLLREDSVPRLTRNQQRIFEHLQGAHRALGAYEIAATLGIKAPMTVYRALTALTRLGLVRPIPSRNVYMARSSAIG